MKSRHEREHRKVATSEIFRHLRPKWFDKNTFQLQNHVCGGISFCLIPIDEKTYNFWIYVCPPDAPFSTKQAVKALRDTLQRGVVPWGTITLTDKKLLDQLVDELLENNPTGSSVGMYARSIQHGNQMVEMRLAQEHTRVGGARRQYEDD